MSDIQFDCHAVTTEGPVCPPTTTFPAECFSKYGGGRPECDIPKEPVPTTVVGVTPPKPGPDLPFTGVDVIFLIIVAVVVLGTGLALLLFRGRRGIAAPASYSTGFVADPYNDVDFDTDER